MTDQRWHRAQIRAHFHIRKHFQIRETHSKNRTAASGCAMRTLHKSTKLRGWGVGGGVEVQCPHSPHSMAGASWQMKNRAILNILTKAL